METFEDYLSKGEPTFKISKTKATKVEKQEVKFINKKREQENKLDFDTDSLWIGGEKTGPWWHLADGDELASLVAQRSLNHIENCDLPHPQNTCFKRDPHACSGNFDLDGIFPSSLHLKARVVNKDGSFTSESGFGEQQNLSEDQNRDNPNHEDITETQIFGTDPSKAQLLEALRHSQTRAREAEMSANQAYTEKEHILGLFFQQASHLFAYKQWFQILQLENLYFHIKNNNQPISTLLPLELPWFTQKTQKFQKRKKKPARRKQRKEDSVTGAVNKFAVAFALGFSLIGAGLLLGWTVGWMLPIF